MITGFVADSSVGVAWAVHSQADADADTLKQLCLDGARVVVPTLWHVELANALLMLLKRRLLSKQDWVATRRDVAMLPVMVDPDGSPLALSRVSDVAERSGLTVYDAVYLELAERRGLPIASRDKDLNKAAKKCGVKTLL